MKGPHEKKGRWYWTLDLGPHRAKLEGIPGLRVNEAESRVEGSVDAIAAALRRTGNTEAKMARLPHILQAYWDVCQGVGASLREYQRDGAARVVWHMREYKGAILADEMGLGKTRTAIAAVQALQPSKVLVCCPAMVRETWAKELAAMGVPDEEVCILRPKPWRKRDRKAWEEQAPKARWIVTSYDLAPAAWQAAFVSSYPDVCVLDEFHLLKGRSIGSRKAARIEGIRDLIPLCTYKLGLSGTPMDDRPRDLWTPLSLILPGRFGTSYSRFDEAYCAGRPGEHGGWENRGRSNPEELALRLSYYMVRRTKAEVRPELPATQHQTLWIDPDEKGKAAFRTALLRKQQGDMDKALESTLEAKIPAAIELALSLPDFFLITKRRDHAKLMSDKLNKAGKKNLLVTGDSSPEKRMQLIRTAAASKLSLVATADSCGLGVDGIQHVTTYGIRHAIEWRPLVADQQHERLGRGRADPVTWYHLVCRDTADELVVEKNLQALDDHRRIIGGSSGYREALQKEPSAQEEAAHLKQLWDSIPDNFGEE
jgi:SNF2 family DNA or RNA helicase